MVRKRWQGGLAVVAAAVIGVVALTASGSKATASRLEPGCRAAEAAMAHEDQAMLVMLVDPDSTQARQSWRRYLALLDEFVDAANVDQELHQVAVGWRTAARNVRDGQREVVAIGDAQINVALVCGAAGVEPAGLPLQDTAEPWWPTAATWAGISATLVAAVRLRRGRPAWAATMSWALTGLLVGAAIVTVGIAVVGTVMLAADWPGQFLGWHPDWVAMTVESLLDPVVVLTGLVTGGIPGTVIAVVRRSRQATPASGRTDAGTVT